MAALVADQIRMLRLLLQDVAQILDLRVYVLRVLYPRLLLLLGVEQRCILRRRRRRRRVDARVMRVVRCGRWRVLRRHRADDLPRREVRMARMRSFHCVNLGESDRLPKQRPERFYMCCRRVRPPEGRVV